MSDLTREQIEACLTTFPGEPDWFSAMDEDAQEAFVRNVFVMALRALDAGWQPMSTAPRDGTRIMVALHDWYPKLASFERFEDFDDRLVEHFVCDGAGHSLDPIAWMPLPPPCAEVPHE